MKPAGEPDAGNPHVRFDERGRETGPTRPRASRAPAPVLDSTQLTAETRDRPAITSLRLLAVLNVLSRTPPLVKRRAPRTDGPLTHFASPPGEKCKLSGTEVSRGRLETRLPGPAF